MMRVAAVLVMALVVGGSGSQTWYSHYDQAMRLIDQGRGAEAREHLDSAVAKRPEPGLTVRVYGNRFIEYLPYLYLTVASHMQGDVDGASSYLGQCEARGIAETSDRGRELLEAYRILLAPSEGTVSDDEPEIAASFRAYPRKDTVLDDDEASRLEREVEIRCGLSADRKRSMRPWYFHYELGLALAEKGDPQRALDAMVAAADRRPVSRRGARMYGMWFTDYLPYFEIAKAHSELANWQCALDALEVSSRMGEVREDDEEYANFRRLLEEARQMQ